MANNINLKKIGNIYISNNIILSKNQKNTANAFSYMWRNSKTYDNPRKSEIQTSFDASNSLFPKVIAKYFKSLGLKEIKFLDVGCGYGYGFKVYFSKYISQIKYVGFDVHEELHRTYRFLNKIFLKQTNSPIIVKASMNKIPNIKLFKNVDFAWAEGTLHHSENIESAVREISKTLKKGGLFMFWTINEQKPLRKFTDIFFRSHFQTYPNSKKVMDELKKIAHLSAAFGKSLGGDKVTLKSKIECLQIKPGTYKLQELLYDYIIKLYYRGKMISRERRAHHLFDWFRPAFYHQISRNKLKKILQKNNLNIVHYIEKTNGHYVVCKKF